MYFVGKQRGMVVNSGNWDAMELVYGPDSDHWTGKPIELYSKPTQTPAGQPTLGCRIRATIDDLPDDPMAAPSFDEQTPLSTAPIQHVALQPQGPGEKAAQDVLAPLTPPPFDGQTAPITDQTVLNDPIDF